MIASRLHERTKTALINFDRAVPEADRDAAREIVKDPVVLDFLAADPIRERDLSRALTDNLARFLRELGTGFAFVGAGAVPVARPAELPGGRAAQLQGVTAVRGGGDPRDAVAGLGRPLTACPRVALCGERGHDHPGGCGRPVLCAQHVAQLLRPGRDSRVPRQLPDRAGEPGG